MDRLESAGHVAFAAHFQETWYTGNILMQFALNEVFSRVPDWGDRLRAGEVSFATDPAYRACVEQTSYVLAHTWPDATSVSNSEATRRFADEEAAMYLTGSWSGTDATVHRALPQDRLFPLSQPDRRFPTDRGAQHHLHEERDHRERRAD